VESAVDDVGPVLNIAAAVGKDSCFEASQCSFSVLARIGGTGIVRSPAADLGRPKAL
jgi:hypothetical protein